MMSELFDEEAMRKRYLIAERKAAIEEGFAEGFAESFAESRAKALDKLIAYGISEKEARLMLDLPIE